MLSLFVWGSQDPYSHKQSFLRSMIEGDYSPADVKSVAEQYKTSFKLGQMSAISLMLVEVDMTTNTVNVVENIAATNPLKKKNIVNPEVLKIREKREQERKESRKRVLASLSSLDPQGITSTTASAVVNNSTQEFFFSEAGPEAS